MFSTHGNAHFRNTQSSDESQAHIQSLEQQLDSALRRIREHEETILHLATVSRQSLHSLRTPHGFICPDCKQDIPHACPSHVTTPSALQLPPIGPSFTNLTGLQTNLISPTPLESFPGRGITGYPVSASSHTLQPSNAFTTRSTNPFTYPPTLGNSARLQANLTGPISQGNLPARHVVAHSACTSFEPSTSNVLGYYPPTSLPLSATSSLATPSHPPLSSHGPSTAIHQYNGSNDILLGKRGMCLPDLECGPDSKRARHNLLEDTRNASQQTQSELYPSEYPVTSSLIPSSNKTTPPTPEAKDGGVTPEQETEVDWLITYNNEIQRALDVTLVRSWDLGTGSIFCVRFSKDGKFLAVGFGENGVTNIHDVQTGSKTCTLRDVNATEYDAVYCLAFSPNGLYLATGLGRLFIWEISKKHVRNIITLSGFVDMIEFSPDGRLIASITYDDYSLEIWNWRDGSRRFFNNIEPVISAIQFSPDGKCILVGVGSGDVQIWNVCTGQLVETLMGHSQDVNGIAFTPDGLGLVTGGDDRSVKYWDISLFRMQVKVDHSAGKEVWNFKEHDFPVCFVAFPSKRWVISCSSDKVRVSNAHNAQLHCEFRIHCPTSPTWWSYFDFSPVSGCLVVVPYGKRRAFLWSLKGILD